MWFELFRQFEKQSVHLWYWICLFWFKVSRAVSWKKRRKMLQGNEHLGTMLYRHMLGNSSLWMWIQIHQLALSSLLSIFNTLSLGIIGFFTPETLNQGEIKEKILFQKNSALYKENTSLFAKDLPALLSFLHLETYLFFLLSN